MSLISVVMPVYNAERYIAEAVESILAQTLADFEFLIIDDGSTDGTAAILRAFAARDPRVRLVTRENRGLVHTLNEMLGMATGELIARMDADDVALPQRFERQVAYLNAHPEVVAAGSRVEWVDPEGRVLLIFCTEEGHDAIDRAQMASKGPRLARKSRRAPGVHGSSAAGSRRTR